ncbi:MAG: hypothetical protein IIC40_02680 [Candidatus Marinimicrobia bacterium]|nr:hypothetical protein [Candidatus Neomarinimicrobiota bacterium]
MTYTPKNFNSIFFNMMFILFLTSNAFSQGYVYPDKPMKQWTKAEFTEWEKNQQKNKKLMKSLTSAERNFGLHNGNRLRTLFYNYGSIGRPNTEPSIEWPIFSGHGYAYEFGALVGAEVIDKRGRVIPIFSDGMIDGGDRNGSGGPNFWGWEPLPGWAVDPNELETWSDVEKNKGGIAVSSRPRTWGKNFPVNEEHTGISIDDWTFNDAPYLWPGQFGDGVLTADLESYYKMDDRWNQEFEYVPYPSDESLGGLGIEVTVRGYQYGASLAEDIIFFIHEVTNVSEKDLDKMVVGMVGDPHIGGASNFSDDWAGFVNNNKEDSFPTNEIPTVGSLVYAWDTIGSGNDFSIPWQQLGWLAFKFLESPGNATDGIDNDGDGMIDESRTDGIDNDGDWDLTDEEALADVGEEDFTNGIDDDGDGRIDDLGDLDKKSDDLDGDGVPSDGDNDFDASDLDESDQLGLTSFAGPVYGTEQASQDDVMWARMTPGLFATDIAQEADNIFIFGSGYFPLMMGQTEKFSVAVIVGQGKEDMFNNAFVAEWIFRLNFQFSKAPDPPNVWAVAGDKKVTLYWDDIAEQSVDPVLGKDFEGYKVYRSTTKVSWGQTITDNTGIGVAFLPIAQFDLIDGIEGTHPTEFASGIHFFNGKETGLVHTYVDSPLINDLTYYYAVASYDSGSVSGKISPLESSKVFGGPNVISDGIVPRKPASGYQPPSVTLTHETGISTGIVRAKIIDRTLVDSSKIYIDFISPKIMDVFSLDDEGDTIMFWDDMTLSSLTNSWNRKFVAGPYEVFIENAKGVFIDTVIWTSGEAIFKARAYEFSGGDKFPRDVEIEFFADSVGSSIFVKPQAINFTIHKLDTTGRERLLVVFYDDDDNGMVTKGDRIVGMTEAFIGTWEIAFPAFFDTSKGDSDTTPAPGSILTLFVTKPFETLERYIIQGESATVNTNSIEDLLKDVAVVPNPYVATSSFEPQPLDVFSVGRGIRRVNFINLPQECTIRIFNVAGEHVRTIEHSSDFFNGTEPWDLLSKDGMDVSYGIYIYHLDAKELGQKIGRIAIIK